MLTTWTHQVPLKGNVKMRLSVFSILLHKTYFAMNTLSTVKKNAMISHQYRKKKCHEKSLVLRDPGHRSNPGHRQSGSQARSGSYIVQCERTYSRDDISQENASFQNENPRIRGPAVAGGSMNTLSTVKKHAMINITHQSLVLP